MLQIKSRVGNLRQKFGLQGDCPFRHISRISSILTRKSSKEKKKEAKTDAEKIEKRDLREKLCQDKLVNGELFNRTGNVTVGIIGGGMESAYAAVLLKQSRLIKFVHVVDVKDTLRGAISDINHIDTAPRVKYFNRKRIQEALRNVNIIALMNEVTPDTSDDNDNCSRFDAVYKYICDVTKMIVQHCPTALVTVMVHPVTALLPMISEIYRCAGWWDPNKIMGSVAIESMRMEAMTANLLDLNPAFLAVPMVAGADSSTVVPLLSCARPTNHFTSEQRDFLLRCLRTADKEIAGTESKVPTLSAGAAAAKFILTLVGGLSGFKNVVGCAYVRSNVLPGCRFFTTELLFGPDGVQRNFGLPKVSSAEITLIERAIPCINEHVEMGLSAVHA